MCHVIIKWINYKFIKKKCKYSKLTNKQRTNKQANQILGSLTTSDAPSKPNKK